MAERQPKRDRSEKLKYVAALAGAGILAAGFGAERPGAALGGSRSAAKTEMAAGKDSMSRQINHELEAILKDLKTLNNNHVKHAHHQRFKSGGKTLDRYYFAEAGQDMSTGKNNWIQVICVTPKGAAVPESCALLYGVPDPDNIYVSYDTGQFMARDIEHPNTYSLENIFKNQKDKWVNAYFNKNGPHYSEKSRTGHGAWHTKHISAGNLMENYEDFTSSTDEFLQIAISKIPPTT